MNKYRILFVVIPMVLGLLSLTCSLIACSTNSQPSNETALIKPVFQVAQTRAGDPEFRVCIKDAVNTNRVFNCPGVTREYQRTLK